MPHLTNHHTWMSSNKFSNSSSVNRHCRLQLNFTQNKCTTIHFISFHLIFDLYEQILWIVALLLILRKCVFCYISDTKMPPGICRYKKEFSLMSEFLLIVLVGLSCESLCLTCFFFRSIPQSDRTSEMRS